MFMDFKAFIKQYKEEAKREYENDMAKIQNYREELEGIKQGILNDSNIPETTEIPDLLTAHSGRTVDITTVSKNGVFHDVVPLYFDPESASVLIGEDDYSPLVGEYKYVQDIYDVEAQMSIYHNHYADMGENIFLQQAKLLGKPAGLEMLQAYLNHLNLNESQAKECLETSLDSAKELKSTIDRGNKLIYPQMQELWQERVLKSLRSIYRGMDVRNALEIMEALDSGVSADDSTQLIDSRYYKNLYEIITQFSKRGVEFARSSSAEYQNALFFQDQETIDRMESEFKAITDRNAKFEAENGKGGMS